GFSNSLNCAGIYAISAAIGCHSCKNASFEPSFAFHPWEWLKFMSFCSNFGKGINVARENLISQHFREGELSEAGRDCLTALKTT
ncbi:hypothetical protein P4K96_19940, partial [Bacillus cereus]|nr:hypothetical protein [Bacillus cereus]